ncbi:hypothetical protein ACPUYX_11630 [Desulfosporosinus sp. SYSU MS00001]|uniref:hypothetical protein n=1 Tax=Desulfosporosinus sp. SYSU MS00001 TaxID=3416284 RepID=UPI003CF8DEC3
MWYPELNKKSLVDKIKRESGEKTYPIWLIFNPKHPVVSNYIWVPVLTEIQDKIFRELHTRINTVDIYKRNIVTDIDIIPMTAKWWDDKVNVEINNFRDIALEYNPKIIISFGAFPYEFLRRVYGIEPEKGPKSWTNSNLEVEFEKSIKSFDINKTNTIPLLRRMSSTRKYKEEQNQNYFEKYIHYVSTKIAAKIIENKNYLNIWIWIWFWIWIMDLDLDMVMDIVV